MSGDGEVMALYLGSECAERKGLNFAQMSRRSCESRNPSPPAFMDRKSLDHIAKTRDHAVWVPACAGTTIDIGVPTPPPQNTRPECPFARAGGSRPRRTLPTAGRRSPRR